ncbi:MAG: FecR domain-containing protein [Myxococcales bacterium]
MSKARKQTSRVVLVVLLLLVGFAGARWVFLRTIYEPPVETAAPRAQPAPAPAPAPAPVVAEAVVESVSGRVERNVATRWIDVSVGDHLRADDSLRTSRGARTALRIGENSRLTVTEGSQLTIRELTEQVHRFQVRGNVFVDYKPDGQRVLRIENEENGAVAEAREARFSVLSTGTSLAIATESGSVDLKSKDQTIHVATGEQAFARAGEAPRPATPIPTQLLLKVANAAAAGATFCADVEGSAPPGAEVLVDGQPVDLDERGRFSIRVPRSPGKRLVTVETRDASGRRKAREVPCVADPARIKDLAIRWKRSASP